MRLDQLAQAPLTISVENERWKVPLFTLNDFLEWASREESRLTDLACGGMTSRERFSFVTMFGVAPVSLEWLRNQVRSPRGARHVATVCLGRAECVERDGKPLGKPQPLEGSRAEHVVNNATADSLTALAVALADPPDPAAEEKAEKEEKPEGDEGESADPLTSSPLAASAA